MSAIPRVICVLLTLALARGTTPPAASSTLENPARPEVGSKVNTGPADVTLASSASSPTYALHPPATAGHYLSGFHVPRVGIESAIGVRQPYAFENWNHAQPLAQHGTTEHSLQPTSRHFTVVSFIGLLVLFALLQNSISAAGRKDTIVDVLSSRRKRDLIAMRGLHPMTPEQRDVLDEDAKVRCIQRIICLENKKLARDLGTAGKVLAKHLTRSVESSLKVSPGWGRLIEDAGTAGLREGDCNVLYRDCDSAASTKSRKET